MKLGISNILLASFIITAAFIPLGAQTYTYVTESFEGNTWPSSIQTTSVTSTTGAWAIVKGYTSSSNPSFDGSKYLAFDNGGTSFRSPELTAGAGTLAFQAYAISGSNRTITVSTSTDGITFSDIFTTPTLSKTDWQKYTVSIKDVNIKYVKLTNSGGGVGYDAVQITPYSFKISPDTLSGMNYVVGSGPGNTKSFTISAINLTAGNPITITAPSNFEVSLDGITWGKTATIPNTAGGSLSSKTVYTRLEGGIAKGDYSGSLTVSGGGKTVPTPMLISGSVSPVATPKCGSVELLTPSRKEDFGTFTSANGRGCANGFYIDSVAFQCANGSIGDTYYSVLTESSVAGSWAVSGPDHTTDAAGTYGGMLFVNSGNTSGKIVYRRQWPVCSGIKLELSAWYADANNHSNPTHKFTPGITFNIYGGNNPNNINNLIIKQVQPAIPLVVNNTAKWNQIIVPFNTGAYTYIKLEITNDVDETDGNDIIIDDIEFKAPPLPIEVCITDAKCNGGTDGEITISRVSGNATFSFVLDGTITKTGTNATFTGLKAGPHTLKVSDGSGSCDVVPNIVLNEPNKLVATATTDPNCIPGSGPIGILASGGSPGYQYSQGSSGPWSNNAVVKGLSNGSYTINVKDVNGCQTTATTIVKCTLPIKWLNFEGYNKDAVNILKWAITESNGDYFIIERSLNGIDFEEINMVKTQSSSPAIQYYYFEDTHPFSGTNYYRLKYVEKNKQYSYSTTISISGNFDDLIKIYPNPNHGKFTISISSEIEDCKIEIVDIEGKIVYSNSSFILPASIQVGSLARGMYMIRFYQNGETLIRKLMVL